MTMETATNPALVQASPDMGIRRGGGMDTDRDLISYQHLLETRKAGLGQRLRRFAVVMRAPDRHGMPGAGPAVAMPAEKAQKWYGQGYRFCVSAQNHDLIPETPNNPPRQWLPSMVDDAMLTGLPIPEEMAPVGYPGETFKLSKNTRAVVSAPIGTPVNLDHFNADGLRAFADEQGIELSNRQSVTLMREEIETAVNPSREPA